MDANKLRQMLRYDRDCGRFFWLHKRGSKMGPGDMAGSFDAHGYGQINIGGKVYKEHRLVWLYVYGEMPKEQIDHINHNRRDNRVENLRLADNKSNHRNRPKQKNNKSGILGVRWVSNAYRTYINVDGRQVNLGRFKLLEDAIAARKSANQKYGFHENHGVGYGISKKAQYRPAQHKIVLDIV